MFTEWPSSHWIRRGREKVGVVRCIQFLYPIPKRGPRKELECTIKESVIKDYKDLGKASRLNWSNLPLRKKTANLYHP